MKAAILRADRHIALSDAALPTFGPGDVLVRSDVAGICGTDVHIYRGEFKNRVQYPAILGHEFGGTIVEVGKAVSGWRVGNRVAVDPVLPCHGCPACHEGHANACRFLKLLGVDVGGGYGEYVSVPAGNLYALPDGVPMHHAPMVEMYGLAHHILRRGGVMPGETVAILGAGKLGLSVLDVLCHGAGAALVLVTDPQPFRLGVAEKLGAARTLDPQKADPIDVALEMTKGVGVDVVIECVGHYHDTPGGESPLQQAVKMIRNGGRVVTCGLGEQVSPVHFKTLVMKEAQIIASRVTAGEFPRALFMMDRGMVHADRLVTHKRPLREVDKAFFQVDQDDPGTLKVVLDMKDI